MKASGKNIFIGCMLALTVVVGDASAYGPESSWLTVKEVHIVNEDIIYFRVHDNSFCTTNTFWYMGGDHTDAGSMGRMAAQLTTALVSNKSVKLTTTDAGCTGYGTTVSMITLRR